MPEADRPAATPQPREGLGVALFGEQESEPAPVVQSVPDEAPATRLDLKLRGVALAEGDQPSLAIVEGSDRKSLPYRVGDTLPGDAELLRIEADRVMLRHRGTVEALYFSEEPPAATARTRTATKPAGAGAVRLSPQSSTRIREYLSLLPSDPTRMTELVRALPVMENGVLKGFRLFPGQQRELFGEVGLRRGDIATRINGLPLDDPARGMELLNQLASASRFQIEILRRGQPQQLDIQL
jgi:general secretion pathway protein C